MSNEDNGYNKVIIVGLITSFIFPIIGLVICGLGLRSMKFDNTKGKGLALIGFLVAPIVLFLHLYFIVWPYAYDKYFKDKINEYKEQKEYSEVCNTIDPNVCYPYNNKYELICAYNNDTIICDKEVVQKRRGSGKTTTTTTTQTITNGTTTSKTTKTTTTKEMDEEDNNIIVIN